MAADLAVRTSHLTRRYGDVLALDDLDLEVQHGSIFGFLGRNGAGKTTTMRLLTGLARPTYGSAWVAGCQVTAGDGRSRAAYGYLPQESAFYGWMTGREYLDYVGGLYGLSAGNRNRRTDELLELVNLKEAADRRVQGYSGGMKQRLGVAQALIHEPSVLFLDEPTSALDPAGRHEVLEMISRLRGSVTVFLSSHIIADVDRICDTVGVIHKGRLLFVLPRQELLDRYAVDEAVLEVAHESADQVASLEALIAQQPWVERVHNGGTELHVQVLDMEAARVGLLPLVVSQGIVLDSFRWVRPSLEDIFLEVSA